MIHGSLFSGIGGFDLAALRIGWTNAFHCEIDPFCQQVLKKHFPKSVSYGDIKTTDFREWRNKIDIVSGGFPCQPFSKAGKQRGVNDERFLWPEMLRAIREIDPSFVVGENVYGISKTALQGIKSSLEDLGYLAVPFNIPASAVGALHRRSRIWIIGIKENALNTNADSIGSYIESFVKQREIELQHEQDCEFGQMVSEGVRAGTYPGVFGNVNGVSRRVDRLRSTGNAVMPQMAYQIFNVIQCLKQL